MAQAYKVIQSVVIPRALSRLGEDVEGNPTYNTEGKLYTEGDYLREGDITPTLRERVANGDFDMYLEPVPESEVEAVELALARAGAYSTFAPEHEVERVTLSEYGHDVLSKKQILAANAAGADAAKATLEAAKEDGKSDRPAITEQPTFVEVPSLAQAAVEGKTVTPDEDPVEADFDPETQSIQTMPSGVVGGAVKAAAEAGGAALTPTTADMVDDGEGKKAQANRRKRPGNKAQEGTTSAPGGDKKEDAGS